MPFKPKHYQAEGCVLRVRLAVQYFSIEPRVSLWLLSLSQMMDTFVYNEVWAYACFQQGWPCAHWFPAPLYPGARIWPEWLRLKGISRSVTNNVWNILALNGDGVGDVDAKSGIKMSSKPFWRLWCRYTSSVTDWNVWLDYWQIKRRMNVSVSLPWIKHVEHRLEIKCVHLLQCLSRHGSPCFRQSTNCLSACLAKEIFVICQFYGVFIRIMLH